METPLGDLTVIDFTRVRAGPWCTQILAELGAEVIKIERPGRGDVARESHPERGGIGVDFIARNRNKQSVAVDLKTDEGLAIAEALLAEADVAVENFSPGTMERLGLAYDDLRERNPGLVYASITGYGETGPYSDRKGVDLVMQAEAGIMSVTGPEGGPPVKVGQAIGDIGAGLYATIAILAALHRRDRTGEGGRVATDLFGTIVSFLEEYITRYGLTGEDPEPKGTRHQSAVPYELFETADGAVVVSVLGVGWETFATEIIGDESLAAYDSRRLRREQYDQIRSVLAPAFREKTTDEWLKIAREYGFPCGPLNRVSDVVEHPQARARDYVIEHEDETVGEVLLHGHPLEFSNAETGIRSGPPKLGEHTEAVLADELGLSEAKIEALLADGVVERPDG